VAICYYKHPLQMAREAAYHALMSKAKGAEWADGHKKGTVCITLRKHSGMTSEALLSCWERKDGGESVYSRFIKLTAEPISNLTLRAMHWKIIDQFDVVWYLLSRLEDPVRSARLEQWFEGNFNEWLAEDQGASSEEKKGKITSVVTFLCAVADQCGKEDKEQVRNIVDGTFRVDEFLHGPQTKEK